MELILRGMSSSATPHPRMYLGIPYRVVLYHRIYVGNPLGYTQVVSGATMYARIPRIYPGSPMLPLDLWILDY